MLCGIGMCGACRVKVGNRTLLTCVDGPEFVSYDVDWQEIAMRLNSYANQEALSFQIYRGANKS